MIPRCPFCGCRSCTSHLGGRLWLCEKCGQVFEEKEG